MRIPSLRRLLMLAGLLLTLVLVLQTVIIFSLYAHMKTLTNALDKYSYQNAALQMRLSELTSRVESIETR